MAFIVNFKWRLNETKSIDQGKQLVIFHQRSYAKTNVSLDLADTL